MRILEYLRRLMTINGALPMFSGTYLSKYLEMFKLIAILFCTTYACISNIVFGVIHFDDLPLVTTAVYVCIGYGMGSCMNIAYFINTNKTAQLLDELESLVNESECLNTP